VSRAEGWPESAFWEYSLTLYGRPGVERACLELQRRHDLDVNLLLLCCWLGGRGIELDQSGLERARRAADSWHLEVVRPLRAIRRRLKIRLAQPEPGSVPATWPDLARRLRAGILALELDGEHLEQLALADALAGRNEAGTPGPALAWRNLLRYRPFEEADRPALEPLLRGAFPDAGPEEIEAALSALAGGPPLPR
jgi:uncharacterized protein (TIGR02444 family)